MDAVSEFDPVTEYPEVDVEEFKRAAGSFVTGVTIVTTFDGDGRPHGCTASSFTSLSLTPPLILFCLDRRAPSRLLIERSGRFAVNVLAAHQADVSRQFARWSEDKFAGIGYSVADSGSPLIEGALAQFACSLDRSYYGGDHVIVIGRVQQVQVTDAPPLVYHRSHYHALASGD